MAPAELGFHHIFLSAADTSAPTLLLLHGTGGDESDLIPIGQQLARVLPRGANLLSPRGKTLENGMPRFFRRLAEGVFDVEDVKLRAGELVQFVDNASTVYGFDRARISAVGYSNGANVAAAMLLLHGSVLSGATLLRPTLPLEPPAVPDLKGSRVLIAAGRNDPYSPAAKVERLAGLLAAGGAAIERYEHPGGHELTESDLDAAARWLAAW